MPIKTLKSSSFHQSQSVLVGILSFLAFVHPLTSFEAVADQFLESGSITPVGSDVGYLLDTPMRLKIDLAGMWDYSIDGSGSGRVRVPAAYDFVGNVVLSRTFNISEEQIDRYVFQLVMYGANYRCEIYLNGDFLVSHSGGYTSFSQPIPANVLQPGSENHIRVVVENELDDRNTVPLKLQVWGWKNYGGILRDVFILATPKLHFRDVILRSNLGKGLSSAIVAFEAAVEGEHQIVSSDPKKPASIGFVVEMLDKISGESVGRSLLVPLLRSEEGWENPRAEVSLSALKLWSPDTPDLYLVKAFLVSVEGKQQTVIDEWDVNYGIRKVEISAANILLNGQRVVLKGVVWNEYHPTWGSALPYEQMEKDIVLIKSLGANAVRFGSHPPHPYMLNLCDRYGLLALVELPVVYSPSSILRDEYYTELAGITMKEMITRDRSHPSVLAWGIGDGFESSSEETRSFVQSLTGLARSLDDRPLYYASVMHEGDVCSDLVDIAAVNVYVRELDVFKRQAEQWKASHPDQPVVVAKFGTEVEQDNRNGYTDPLSYEAQARFYLQRLDALKSLAYDGAFVWAMNDWRGDRPALTVSTGDPLVHSMGLVSDRREKRLAYDAVRSVFRGEKFVALPSGNYSAAAPIIYVLSGLVLLIGTAYLYNADRRFRESLNRSMLSSYNFFADIRDQRVVSAPHSAILGMICSVALAIVMSTILYHYRDNWVLDAALSYLLPSDRFKEFMIRVILEPMQFILYFSLIFFLKLLLICLIVYLASALLRSRMYFYHAYSLTMWAVAPLLILIPLGMILFRLLESGVYVVPSLALVGALLIWVLLRLLKGVSIVADVFRLKVYMVGLVSLSGIVVAGFFYLDYTQSASEYLTFLYNVVRSSY